MAANKIAAPMVVAATTSRGRSYTTPCPPDQLCQDCTDEATCCVPYYVLVDSDGCLWVAWTTGWTLVILWPCCFAFASVCYDGDRCWPWVTVGMLLCVAACAVLLSN